MDPDDSLDLLLTHSQEPRNSRTKVSHNTTLTNRPKYRKKKTFCEFCKTDVTNFERHLQRNHQDRKEVREMMQYPLKSVKRKQCLELMRNAGNFEEYLKGNIRPKYQKRDNSNDIYIPCAFCKGMFKKSFLHRHYKHCAGAHISNDLTRIRHLSASQSLVASALSKDNTLQQMRVKNEVFDRMKADHISMVAKTDTLIVYFGEQYLKKHRRKQMTVVCSNKMRELARLLIYLREIECNNENFELIDALDPVMFDKVIECAKRVGGYDSTLKTYRAPSVSAHLGTSLKHASEILMYLIQKKSIQIRGDSEAKFQSVKMFHELVISHWTTEISSLAFKDLNEKKWNKPLILPLTQNVLKFRDYVTGIANEALDKIQKNKYNVADYKSFVNATLALTILYNRRRIGDVQYTQFNTYIRNVNATNQEELMDSLSPSERMLTKNYKKVVTGGKGSRPIIILFPKNIQVYMQEIVKIRQQTDLIQESNEYLFAHPGTDRWLRGDEIIRKYAIASGIENPEYISSNKLRKQIATVMQILNLQPDEAEQFALFMGHTGKTHDDFYK